MKDKILQIKKENPTWGYKKIAKELNCTPNAVKYHLYENIRKYFLIRRNINKRKGMTRLKMEFGGKCTKCGYNKCLDALHFHHINSNEKINTVNKIFRLKGFLAAIEETKKCELICANCNAELHSKLVPSLGNAPSSER